MKILVILTGGTIGSRRSGNIIDVNEAAAYSLIGLYQEKYGGDVEFEAVQPYNILSENLNPSYWKILLDCLDRMEFDRYDGIIIAHGSDTFSYTAAMTGLYCSHTPIPIVLIASNYELQDARSNGLSNFYHAVCFIREKKMKGVFAIFQNDRGENIVYLSTRLQEADTYRDQFSSYGGVDFGKIEGGHFQEFRHIQNPAQKELNAPRERLVVREGPFRNQVLLIRPYPGLDYDSFLIRENVSAILHCTYHSSTVCTADGTLSATAFIKRCTERGVPVYACSFKQTEDLYATSAALLEAGAIPLASISTEAAYCKLLLAYNQRLFHPEELMKKNIFYEIIV